MKKSAWYVILIMVVLIASIAVTASSFFGGDSGKDSGNEPGDSISGIIPPVDGSAPASPGLDIILPGTTSPSPTPGINVQQPQQGQNNQQNNNNNNQTRPQAPANTPAPPAPTPTPPPAPTPTPVQTVSGSGSFSSNTGTGLNIKVDWKAYNAADGTVMLQIDVSASSYSFYTSSLWDSIWVKVGGVSYSASSPAISYDGNDLLYSHMATFYVPASTGNVGIDVVWHYNGSYSGKELGNIEASGSAWIS